MKLCKDCAHKGPDPSPYFPVPAKCWSPSATRSPVYGNSVEDCLNSRKSDSGCGPEGRWFEPKPPRKTWFAHIFGG